MIQIKRVTPKNLFNQLVLQKFQIASIQGKYANKTIQILKQLNTLPEDTFFLKRIRKIKQNHNQENLLQLLLCLTQQKDTYLKNIQNKFKQEFNLNIIKEIKTINLPRYAPISKKDFQLWTQYWPCTYFQPEFMKDLPHSKQQTFLIEQIYNNFIQNQNQLQQNFILFSQKEFLFSYQNQDSKLTCDSKNPLNHSLMILAQKWPNSDRFRLKQNQFYYFTGLRLFIKSKKICGMCSMALVHSRVDRIYFQANSIPEQTILEILYSLKLNHRINLFKIDKK